MTDCDGDDDEFHDGDDDDDDDDDDNDGLSALRGTYPGALAQSSSPARGPALTASHPTLERLPVQERGGFTRYP